MDGTFLELNVNNLLEMVMYFAKHSKCRLKVKVIIMGQRSKYGLFCHFWAPISNGIHVHLFFKLINTNDLLIRLCTRSKTQVYRLKVKVTKRDQR